MAKKPAPKKVDIAPVPEFDFDREVVVLGHLIKYNLYLLAKTNIFSSLLTQTGDVDKSISETTRVMSELDLDTKTRSER